MAYMGSLWCGGLEDTLQPALSHTNEAIAFLLVGKDECARKAARVCLRSPSKPDFLSLPFLILCHCFNDFPVEETFKISRQMEREGTMIRVVGGKEGKRKGGLGAGGGRRSSLEAPQVTMQHVYPQKAICLPLQLRLGGENEKRSFWTELFVSNKLLSNLTILCLRAIT